ncbi:MAG: GAF domain-containing protein [Geminicoccaceae bacterium]|nr:GAF domain-containing protein [Geminicoccaceae bacterium]
MTGAAPLAPAFGEADLSNCEREPIHLAGSIQPHGALLVVREPDLLVLQASANAAGFLGLEGPLPGRSLAALSADLAEQVRARLDQPLDRLPVVLRRPVWIDGRPLDVVLHRPPEAGLVLEFERPGPPVDLAHHVETATTAILACTSLKSLAEETTRIFKDLTGYDRVMVYRFDAEGHGEVFAERREPGLDPYLGNRYPASDIPQIARRLYERNRIRVLVDVDAERVPIEPRLSPLTGRDLDMSLCFLRSISPIHIRYLKNMGVAATLVASLVVGGRLWGLIACHHYEPRRVAYEVRAVCELLAETVATRIAALESFLQAQAELSVRRLEQRMHEAIAREGDWRSALFEGASPLLQPVGATGAALLLDGQVSSVGEVPGTAELRAIGAWLDRRRSEGVVATASLGLDEPAFEPLRASASGLLAVSVSALPGEWLLWFRPERVRTVTWGGNPFKPVEVGDSPEDLSPRRSFAKWHQLVQGTADPWSPADLAAARLIGDTLRDLVLQFRAVRLLIAQDQLDQIGRQVDTAEQAVLIADAQGRILMANRGLHALFGGDQQPPRRLDELPARLADPDAARLGLRELVEDRRTWRAEIQLPRLGGEPLLLSVRADPVLVPPGRLLGFVLMFSDLSGERTAQAARHRLQADILERHRLVASRLQSEADLLFRRLLQAIVGNAQLAALEITDGADLARVSDMLESVRASLGRATALLEQIVAHTREGGRDPA